MIWTLYALLGGIKASSYSDIRKFSCSRLSCMPSLGLKIFRVHAVSVVFRRHVALDFLILPLLDHMKLLKINEELMFLSLHCCFWNCSSSQFESSGVFFSILFFELRNITKGSMLRGNFCYLEIPCQYKKASFWQWIKIDYSSMVPCYCIYLEKSWTAVCHQGCCRRVSHSLSIAWVIA